MKVVPCLDALISQAEFAEIIGVSEARVSQLVSEGVIARGDTCAGWLIAYCERLRDQAAGRVGADGAGGLDLVQERAALAREQRIAQAMKNKVASGEFAPIGILADVLGQAASGVVDRMDQLEGDLRKACPDLPEDARAVVLSVVAKARNEWLRSTAKLVADKVDELAEDFEDEAAVMEDHD